VRGIEVLQQAVIDHLRFELDRKLPLLRTAWTLDAATLPDMAKVVAGETADEAITSADEGAATWAVVTIPRLLRGPVPVEIDPAGRFIHLSRYACQIGVWVRHTNWRAAQLLRDRMAAACRACVLEYPTLDSQHRGDSGRRLVLGSYVEQFGTPVRIRAKSVTWAGAALLFEVETEESLADGSTQIPLGAVDTMTTGAAAVGPGQPFPNNDEEAPP
jgi:hypothetical protein